MVQGKIRGIEMKCEECGTELLYWDESSDVCTNCDIVRNRNDNNIL